MKRITAIITAALALFPALLAAKEVKILTIGNSFAASVFAYLPEIAKEYPDCDLVLEGANHGGCTFQRHWKYICEEEKNPEVSRYNKPSPDAQYCTVKKLKKSSSNHTMRALLESRKWDVVTIQQASPMSFVAESFAPEAELIMKYVKKHAPTAEIVAHQTWSYRADSPRLVKEWKIDQNEMFAKISANYEAFAKKYNLRVLPSGAAVQNCRAAEKNPFKPISEEELKKYKYPDVPSDAGDVVGRHRWKQNKKGEWKLGADCIHLNERGKYLQSCLWFGFLFDKDPAEIKFVPEAIAPQEAAALRNIAAKTLREFKQPRDLK